MDNFIDLLSQYLRTNKDVHPIDALLRPEARSLGPCRVLLLRELLKLEENPREELDMKLLECLAGSQELHQLGKAFLFYQSHFRYPSLRPLTRMPFVRSKKSLPAESLILAHRRNQPFLVDGDDLRSQLFEDELFIPVVRYARGMNGLFYPNSSEACGTFYYFEPDSGYFLRSNRTLLTFNKISAYNYLSQRAERWTRLHFLRLVSQLPEWPSCLISLNGQDYDELQPQLFNSSLTQVKDHPLWAEIREWHPEMTGEEPLTELAAWLSDQRFLEWILVLKVIEEGNRPVSLHCPPLYAEEDIFDRPICELANEQGIEVVIFLRMTGERRVVSEVYDVRLRTKSYANLYQNSQGSQNG